MLHVEYEFREEDLVHFNQVRFMQTEEYHNNIKKNRWYVPGLMTFVAAFYYYYYGDMKSAAYIMGVAVLWSLLSPRIILLDIHRRILRQYTYKEKKQMLGLYKLTIDPQNPHYLLEKSPSGSNKIAWSEIVRVERSPKYVYIYLDLTTAMVIPVEMVKDGDLDAFTKQVEKMIERFA
jgi:YcxB-like protein